MLGLIAGVAIWASSLLRFSAGSLLPGKWNLDQRRNLAGALLLSSAALFLNPVGIKLILYPFDTMLHMPLLLASVAEYAPLEMASGRGIALMAVLLLSFALVMMNRSQLYWDEIILLAMGTWLAVSHMRMVFVFGILAAPILSRQLAASWDRYDAEKDRAGLNAAFVALALLVVYLGFPSRANLQEQVEEQSPVKAVEFIKANHLAGPMMNAHGFGGYLMWAAPEHPVFIDGRTDVFEWTGVLREFGDWSTLQNDPSLLLNKYGVTFCLLNPESPMVRVLPLLPEWKIIYSDSNSVIIARSPAQAKAESSAQMGE
jgi:hypothetical protein